MIEILIFIYFLIAIPFYGLFFAFWQRNWPDLAEAQYKEDMIRSIIFALFWPICMISFAFSRHRYQGFKFW